MTDVAFTVPWTFCSICGSPGTHIYATHVASRAGPLMTWYCAEHMPVPGDAPTPRTPGLNRGTIAVSDNFDDPLELQEKLPIVRLTVYSDGAYEDRLDIISPDGTVDGWWERDMLTTVVERALRRHNATRVIVERVEQPAPEEPTP